VSDKPYAGPELPSVVEVKKQFPDFTIDVPNFIGKLDPHQHICVAASHVAKRWLNMDKVGLGKTVETIGLIAYQASLGIKPRWVIVVEGSHLFQWKESVERFTDLKATIVRGTRARRHKIYRQAKNSDEFILLVTYGSVRVDFDAIKAIQRRSMAYDEAAILANENKTREFAEWLNQGCEYVVAMSAEPVTRGDPTQLWLILKTIGVELGLDKEEFQEKFCQFHERRVRVRGRWGPFMKTIRQVVGLKRSKQLTELIASSVIRRGDSVLPSGSFVINRQIRSCPMTNYQKDIYKHIVKGVLKKVASLTEVEKLNTADYITQILVSPWVNDDDAPQDSPKMDLFLELLKTEMVEIVDGEETPKQCVVFCKHLRSCELLARKLKEAKISHSVFTGEITDPKVRHDQVQKFKEGKSRIFVMSAAGHRGIDGLQVCNNIVLMDVVHSPSFVMQLLGRLARKGQLNKIVNVFFLMCDDTVEQKVLEKLHDRQTISDRIYDEDRADIFDGNMSETLVELL